MSGVLSKRLMAFKDNSSVTQREVSPKDSFERFGDDLSEVLLSYLSFEDKFRYECLSKRIQTFVFNKQIEIIDRKFVKKRRLKGLKFVFKKCPNIRRVVLTIDDSDESEDKYPNRDEVREQIAEECNNMSVIRIEMYKPILDYNFRQFLTKVGPKIKRLELAGNGMYTKYQGNLVPGLLEKTPNLEFLFDTYCPTESPFEVDLYFNESEILFKNLQSINTNCDEKEFQKFEILVQNNKNTLNSLFIGLWIRSNTSLSQRFFQLLSEGKKIRTLKISTDLNDDSLFVDQLKEFSQKSPNLKNISYFATVYKSSPFQQSLQSLNGFKKLNTLRIWNFMGGPLPVEPPKDCPNLTNLSFIGDFIIKDDFFDLIVERLPRLQYIECEKTDITDNTIKSLSKLKKLREIKLRSVVDKPAHHQTPVPKTELSESVFFDLIEKSQQMIGFKFNTKHIEFKLTAEGITALREGGIPSKGQICWNSRSKAKHKTQYPRLIVPRNCFKEEN